MILVKENTEPHKATLRSAKTAFGLCQRGRLSELRLQKFRTGFVDWIVLQVR